MVEAVAIQSKMTQTRTRLQIPAQTRIVAQTRTPPRIQPLIRPQGEGHYPRTVRRNLHGLAGSGELSHIGRFNF